MRRSKTAFVALFLGLLIIPLLDTVLRFLPEAALDEKRLPAPPPDLVGKIFHGDGRLSAEVNRWFDDHLRSRGLLIRINNQLDYSIFRHAEKIYIGRDGWLFQPGFFEAKVRIEREGDEGARRRHRLILGLAHYLAERNIRLIVISNPMKGTIFPQFLPANVPHLPANDRFQQLRQFLGSEAGWGYIDGEDLLRKSCMEPRPFHLMDIHMTMPGGLCFAKELVRRVALAEGRTASPWDHEFTFTPAMGYGGGQIEFLSLLFPPQAPVFNSNVYYGPDNPGSEGAFAKDPAGLFEWVYHTAPPYRASKLPAIVLFGNSFLDHYVNVGVFTYFTDAYRARAGDNFEDVLRSLPPETRYFVYQLLEPFMNDYANDVGLKHLLEDPGGENAASH
jgi:SGNH hydrolase-like domain, acetyltransferase AlgX